MLPPVTRTYPGYIFDLDGTVWLTDRLVPGADRAVAALRGRGSRIVFLTNNSVGTRATFARRLTDLGVPAGPEEINSSSFVMARYLAGQAPGCRCYVIGHDPLREELCAAGLHLCDRPGEIDYVVLGVDRDFSYHKLQTAFLALRAGAAFVATNADPYCPGPEGDLADIGAMIAAIEVASGHRVDLVVGKPNPYILGWALKALDLPAEDCLLVGDQLGTDVLAGRQAGIAVALLLRDPLVVAQLAGWPTPPDFGLAGLPDLVVGD